MNNLPGLEDFAVFIEVAKRASFISAAEQLGMSGAFVSKRVRVLEQSLGVRLLHRSTRRVVVTDDGQRVLRWAQQILDDVGRMGDELSQSRSAPSGLLRIVSSQGVGRQFVAPAISGLAATYPALDIRLDVYDHLVDLVEERFDIDVRVGNDIAAHLIAKLLSRNQRILCASPGYLAERGTPECLADLGEHDCLVIKERDHPLGIWTLDGPTGAETVKVNGSLSTNHGEVARQWCLDGRGILLRSWWDVAPSISSGALVRVLDGYSQPADIWAVYTAPMSSSPRVRVAVECLQQYFQDHYLPMG
ncbi:LysR substrate-binding domain-containing protein [Pseudomonas sp. Teo4]|uniref:LysR substrate-binding domain-containing protein n=1 Tax=Pseudomonas sp. Teo4 TaxID=3064528 RepID=UPI002ABCA8DF|nr:LysR substrate-binding domain-containing protein [Pseudomonas sp. Teo4]MDZ3992855.1 HTH-type transcriptional regulator DmlR [Pseudomonas sp. Teo4]